MFEAMSVALAAEVMDFKCCFFQVSSPTAGGAVNASQPGKGLFERTRVQKLKSNSSEPFNNLPNEQASMRHSHLCCLSANQ